MIHSLFHHFAMKRFATKQPPWQKLWPRHAGFGLYYLISVVVMLPTGTGLFISFAVTSPGFDQCVIAAGKCSLLQSGHGT